MDNLVFTASGYVVHRPNPAMDHRYDDRQSPSFYEFGQRQPVIVKGRDIYVGDRNWEHGEAADHHNISTSVYDDQHGYFGGGPKWGNGNLLWYMFNSPTPGQHAGVAQALEQAGYPIPNHQYKEEDYLGEEDWEDDMGDLTVG